MNRTYYALTIMLVLLITLSTACARPMLPPVSLTPITLTNTPATTDTPAPTSTPSAFPTVPPGQLINEVYVGGGAGGGDIDICENPFYLPPAGTSLPTIQFLKGSFFSTSIPGLMALCVYGIPQNEIIHLALNDPDGQSVGRINIKFVNQGDYTEIIHIPDGNADYGKMGIAYMTDGISVMHLDFWQPVGLSAGNWSIIFSYNAGQYKGKFEATESKGIDIGPEHIDPLDSSRICAALYGQENNRFKIGETIFVYGRGFKAGADVPVGLYYDTGNKKDGGMLQIYSLAHSLMAKADADGNFKAWALLDDSYKPGTYFYSTDDLNVDYSHPGSCFYIPAVAPNPDSSNSPTPQSKGSAAPVFDHLDQYEQNKNGQLVIYANVYFSDQDGDAYLIKYDLQSVVPYSSGIRFQNDSISTTTKQITGTYKTINWECGTTHKTYTITLKAIILDQMGHQSLPFAVVFKCH